MVGDRRGCRGLRLRRRRRRVVALLRPLREPALTRSLFTRNAFIYGHFPLTLGLVGASVGIKKAIEAHDGHGMTVILLGGGLALYLLSLAAMRAASAVLPPVAAAATVAGILVALALVEATPRVARARGG
ncbi:MAG: hypothetical protein GEV03_17340 [Streptosporangiales bacterium]|nr:hypothetical protein [Streptosporangiales bacterium]